MPARRLSQQSLARREFLQLCAVAATGAAATACVPPAPSQPAAQPPPAEQPTEKPAEKPAEIVEIPYMLPDRELSIKASQVFVDAYNEKMTKEGKPWRAKLSIGPATDTDFLTKITVDAAAGTLADVVSLNPVWMADMVAAGYLADLTPYVQKWPDWQHFYPVIQDNATFDGKVRVVPGGTTFTFFYRKDVLDAAGIPTTQPNTWDDFYGICDQIKTKAKVIPVCLPAATQWGGGTWEEGFRHVWLSFPGTIYDTADKKWVVSSPNLLKTFQVYETLAKNDWLTVQELLGPNPWEPTKYQEFPEGKLAICTGGDWQWEFDWGPNGATPIEGLFDKVERWKFPSEDGKPFVFAGMHGGMAVSAKSKNPDAAFEFVAVSYANDVQCKSYEIYLGGPSGRDDIADTCEYYRTAVNGKMVEASSFFATGRYLRPYPGDTKIADGVARATEDIITGKATSEEAMAQFAKAMKDSLGEEYVKEG